MAERGALRRVAGTAVSACVRAHAYVDGESGSCRPVARPSGLKARREQGEAGSACRAATLTLRFLLSGGAGDAELRRTIISKKDPSETWKDVLETSRRKEG